jgi:hypothetical protein
METQGRAVTGLHVRYDVPARLWDAQSPEALAAVSDEIRPARPVPAKPNMSSV